MRRLVVLFVVSLAGAGVFGLSGASSGLSVNGAALSASTVRAELRVISTNPTVGCFVTALARTSLGAGAGAGSIGAAGAASWSSLRVEGVAIEQFVAAKFHYAPSAAALAVARSSLVAELTQAATAAQLPCTGTSSQALAAMPGEMRDALIRDQAASIYLVGKLNTTIPLTSARIQEYYQSHVSSYDTICVSVALVSPAQVSAFESAAQAGQSILQLVRAYSLDQASKAKGGALGCYSPGQAPYTTVRADVAGTSLGHFSSSPKPISLSGSTYALFLAPTTRTVTPFAAAASVVYADVQALNAQGANTAKGGILYRAVVAIDPAFGRWGLGSSGPGVFAPATPPTRDVVGASLLVRPNATPYQ